MLYIVSHNCYPFIINQTLILDNNVNLFSIFNFKSHSQSVRPFFIQYFKELFLFHLFKFGIESKLQIFPYNANFSGVFFNGTQRPGEAVVRDCGLRPCPPAQMYIRGRMFMYPLKHLWNITFAIAMCFIFCRLIVNLFFTYLLKYFCINASNSSFLMGFEI